MSLLGKRVLLVEDDVLLMMSLQDMVADFGCTVADCAMSVGAALELARDTAIDIAVLDVNLQGELVTPVAELLAARGVPFIFATGYDALIVPSLAGRPRVAKPYRAEQIRDAMLRALSEPPSR
jgi:DNA-binding response OmpR family regulator